MRSGGSGDARRLSRGEIARREYELYTTSCNILLFYNIQYLPSRFYRTKLAKCLHASERHGCLRLLSVLFRFCSFISDSERTDEAISPTAMIIFYFSVNIFSGQNNAPIFMLHSYQCPVVNVTVFSSRVLVKTAESLRVFWFL